MKRLIFALCLAAAPLGAQETPPAGSDLLRQGAESLLRELMGRIEPGLNEMAQALEDMRPMAEDLMALIDNIGNYEPPAILPNGDILIRRKPAPPAPLKEGEIEL